MTETHYTMRLPSWDQTSNSSGARSSCNSQFNTRLQLSSSSTPCPPPTSRSNMIDTQNSLTSHSRWYFQWPLACWTNQFRLQNLHTHTSGPDRAEECGPGQRKGMCSADGAGLQSSVDIGRWTCREVQIRHQHHGQVQPRQVDHVRQVPEADQ